MRQITLVLGTVTALCASLMAPAAASMELDQVLAMNYEARGGLKAIKSIQSLRMTGTTLAMGQVEAPMLIEVKRPNMVRVEFTVQGMTAVQAYDGEAAWMIMPFMGKPDPQPMPKAQAEGIVTQSDIDGVLVDWKDKGHTVELMGTEDVQGTPAYKLKVTRADGDETFIYLDTEHGIEILQTMQRTVPGQGTEMKFETYFSDYKQVGGVMMPHHLETHVGDRVLTNITVDSIEVNPEIPDERFVMPEPTPEAETEPATN
jgi:outer membrane lipoprotein-sorting protein